ncbi:MAG: type I 3-dehydroquinate dehydratase [Thermoproteus sp. AZ2]|uniref:Type I 3-dehydroquinate dehydratase n=1 Tax=Thermoproteus sp. AZ2 TaxID=1609232 RepID=A0ACC6UZQ7_9CREN
MCATVLAEAPKDLERALQSPARCIEARLDPYRGDWRAASELLAKLAQSKVVIATIRSKEEGGLFRGGEEERLGAYLRALEAGPQYVDVELNSEIKEEVVKAKGTSKIILSVHDFSGTPPLATLKSWADAAVGAGADVVKIATTARSWEDNFALLSLIGSAQKPTVAFAMGPLGLLSRVFAPLMGAPFTYAALDKPAAPGQLPYGAMEAIYASLGLYSDLKSLGEMRIALDAVDTALMHLLKLRLAICRDMGRLKKSMGLPIYDDVRETEVLKRAGDFRQLFDLVVQMCKAVQVAVEP